MLTITLDLDTIIYKYPSGELGLNPHSLTYQYYQGFYTNGMFSLLIRITKPEHILAMYLLSDYFKKLTKITNVVLCIPYFPFSREDKPKFNAQSIAIPSTLSTFCTYLDSLGFTTITTIDVHSPIIHSFFKNCILQDISLDATLSNSNQSLNINYLSTAKDLLLVFPDAGSLQRYSYIKTINQPVSFNKVRNQSTGKITSSSINFDINILKNYKKVLVFDDICDGGSTFVHVGNQLLPNISAGAELSLYTTHGMYTSKPNINALFNIYKNVYCCDTYYTRQELVAKDKRIQCLEINY